jgi:hypothetical protein
MPNRGRRAGITSEKTKALVDAIKGGAFIETAVVIAGVPRASFYRWLKQGSEDEQAGRRRSPYIGFASEIRKALAIAELDLVRRVQSSGMHWQRYAWMLERRFPDRWSRNGAQSNGVRGGNPA